MKKRILIMLLVFCLLVGIDSSFFLVESSASSPENDWTIFDALGIDTSVEPDNLLDDDDNPLGSSAPIPSYTVSEFLSFTGVEKPSNDSIASDEGKDGEDENGEDIIYLYQELNGDRETLDLNGIQNLITAYKHFNSSESEKITSNAADAYIGVAGDFTGDGKNGQVVAFGAFLDKRVPSSDNPQKDLEKGADDEGVADLVLEGGILALQFINPTDNKVILKDSEKIIYSFNKEEGKSFGNEEVQAENFIKFPYQLQNYLQMTTGDFNDDGIDEIAVYVADADLPRIEIYMLTEEDSFPGLERWEIASNWTLYRTHNLNCSEKTPNMVDLLADDVTLDGIDDLCIAWGYFYGQEIVRSNTENHLFEDKKIDYATVQHDPSQILVLKGSRGLSPLDANLSPDISLPDGIVRVSIDYDDITGDGRDELVVCGQPLDDIISDDDNGSGENGIDPDDYANKKATSRYLSYYMYNYKANFFALPSGDAAVIIDVIERSEKSLGKDYQYYSVPGCNTNLTTVSMNGPGNAAYVYLDSVLYSCAEGVFNIEEFYYEKMKINEIEDGSYFKDKIGCDGDEYNQYVEYGVIAADYNGDGIETISTMTFYPQERDKDWYDTEWANNDKYGSSSEYLQYHNAYWWWFTDRVDELNPDCIDNDDRYNKDDINAKVYMRDSKPGVLLYQELGKINDEYSVLTSKIFKYQFKGEDDSHDEKDNLNQTTKLASFFVAPDTDNDSMTLEYTGEREMLYTDPEVLAVLASPPVFEDLSNMEGGDDYFGNSTTVFGDISGYSSTSSMNGLFSVGGYFNFEKGIKQIYYFEMEFEYVHDMTFISENTMSVEQTIEYETAMQDTVIMYSIPIECYTYKVTAPNINPDGSINDEPLESELTITVPYDPVMQAFLLEDYDAIAEQYPDLLVRIGGDVLTHTVGKPETYNNYIPSGANTVDADLIKVGYGEGASITQELSITEEHTSGIMHSDTLTIKAGGGNEHVRGGGIISGGVEYGTVTTDLEGYFFSTTMVNMPKEAEQYGYEISSKPYQYMYSNGKAGDELVEFPVVTHMVTDMKCPPKLPNNFEIAATNITSDSMTLTWDANIYESTTSFTIYKERELGSGSSFVEIGTVNIEDYDCLDGDIGSFSYTDKDLFESTRYTYVIQSTREIYPERSIKSPTITAKTASSLGSAIITMNDPITGKVINDKTIYTDAPYTIPVTIVGVQNEADDNFIYQWQKRNEDGFWSEAISQIGSTDALVFEEPSTDDEGCYRLILNEQIARNEFIASYSDEINVTVLKKEIDTKNLTIDSNKISNDAGINMVLSCSKSDSIPSSDLEMTIYNDNYYNIVSVQPEINIQTGESTYAYTFKSVPTGIYNLKINYRGDKIFYPFIEKGKLLVGTAEAYEIEVDEDICYGEAITTRVYKHTYDENDNKKVEEVSGAQVTIEHTDSNLQSGDAGVNIARATVDSNKIIKEFNISKRSLTLKLPSKILTQEECDKQYIKDAIIKEAVISEGSLALGDTIQDIGLTYEVFDSADNLVSFGSNLFPGYYSMSYVYNGNNYNITAINGTYQIESRLYTLTGIIHDMNGNEIDDSNINNIGTMEVISPKGHEPWITPYPYGMTVVIRALPIDGYKVDRWEIIDDDGTIIVNGDDMFNRNEIKQEIDSNTTIKLYFKRSFSKIEFSVDGIGGTIIAKVSEENILSGTSLLESGEIDFTAVADNGYHFKKWTKVNTVGTTYPNGCIDINGNHTYKMKVESFDENLKVQFERDRYRLYLNGNIEAYTDSKSLESGDEVIGDTTVYVTPRPGYVIADTDNDGYDWSANIDSGTISQDGQTFTFDIIKNTSVSALTEVKNYDVEISSSRDGIEHSLSLAYDNQTIELPDSTYTKTYEGGSSIIITANDLDTYKFDSFAITGNPVYYVEGNKVFITALSDDVSVYAKYIPKAQYSLDCIMNNSNNGGFQVIRNDNSSIIVNSSQTVKLYEGDNVTIKAIAPNGQMVSKWTYNGETVNSQSKTLTIPDVQSNQSVSVIYIPIVYYDVFFSPPVGGGSIVCYLDGDMSTPFVSGQTYSIGAGTRLDFVAIPSEGKMINGWTLNGKVVKYPIEDTEKEYTF